MDDELVTYSQESDILFTRSIKAGRRIYYLDVKQNNTGELFLAITESKRVLMNEENREIQFEKHKIFRDTCKLPWHNVT